MMLFDLKTSRGCDFDNFATGAEQHQARQAAERAATTGDSAYLWGRSGTGKTHLLTAAGHLARRAGKTVSDFAAMAQHSDLVLIDELNTASATAGNRLFALLKACLQDGAPTVLVASTVAPGQLQLRHDVHSRLAQLPAFYLPSLSDNELSTTLIQHAAEFGRKLDPEVARLLVVSLSRNIGYLTRMLTELDLHAIEAGEQLTAPFARRWLRYQHDIR